MELHRAEGVLDLDVVTSKKLLFLGTGSLGSLTVANLAYPWKEIVLVDPDNLEQENVERHLLGKRYLGRPKVEGVADYLADKGIDPSRITTHHARAEEILPQHTDADVIIVSIDEEPSLHAIDEWCADNGIPALYGGIYPRGTGGEVIVIMNPDDICYNCAAQKMNRTAHRGKPADYGVNPEEYRGVRAVPALHWVVNSTAADMADLALEILSGENPKPQILVRAHNTWEPILNIGSGTGLNVLRKYIANGADTGMVPNMKLEKIEGRCTLKANRSLFTLSLDRGENCFNHEAGTVSLDEL